MNRRVELIEHFQRLHPPTFEGTEGPEKAEAFMHRLEKIYKLIGCNDEEKLILAEYHLQGEADHWWEVMKESTEGLREGSEWTRFKAAFLDKYFPYTLRETKAQEFELLVQGRMTVDEYERKYMELSRYALVLVRDPEMKARRFERGLNPQIRSQVAPLMLTTYEDVYRRAQKVEKTFREVREEAAASASSVGVPLVGRKRPFRGRDRSMSFGKRPSTSNTFRSFSTGRDTRGMPPPRCPKCGMCHVGAMCPGGGVRCYQCGQPGHIRWNCPQRTASGRRAWRRVVQGQSRLQALQ